MTHNWSKFREDVENYYHALAGKEALLKMWEANPKADPRYLRDLRTRVQKMRTRYMMRQKPINMRISAGNE